jgi:hypothetical protein
MDDLNEMDEMESFFIYDLDALREERERLEAELEESRAAWLREWERLTEDMPPLGGDDEEPGDGSRRPAARKQGAGHPARRGRA